MIRWIMRRRRKAGGDAADIQDRDGTEGMLKRSEGLRRRRLHPAASYRAQYKTHAALEIVKRPPGPEGFVLIRRRWVVEAVAREATCPQATRHQAAGVHCVDAASGPHLGANQAGWS